MSSRQPNINTRAVTASDLPQRFRGVSYGGLWHYAFCKFPSQLRRKSCPLFLCPPIPTCPRGNLSKWLCLAVKSARTVHNSEPRDQRFLLCSSVRFAPQLEICQLPLEAGKGTTCVALEISRYFKYYLKRLTLCTTPYLRRYTTLLLLSSQNFEQ